MLAPPEREDFSRRGGASLRFEPALFRVARTSAQRGALRHSCAHTRSWGNKPHTAATRASRCAPGVRHTRSVDTGVKNLTITTPSQWLANQVSKSFLQNYPRTIIPNGIDRTIFRPQSSSLREKYHLEDKKIVLGVANAWNARKGLQDLLTLAGRLGSDYQVVLIGLIKKQLPDIPSDVLGLLRTANQAELAQWYSAADVFVNPTYEETFGLTTVEAQACGTPVVVYETDGCPETVAPGNGRLISRGDMQALENAVRDVADSNWRADPKKMVRFDKDTVYQDYVELYENVLSTLKKGV